MLMGWRGPPRKIQITLAETQFPTWYRQWEPAPLLLEGLRVSGLAWSQFSLRFQSRRCFLKVFSCPAAEWIDFSYLREWFQRALLCTQSPCNCGPYGEGFLVITGIQNIGARERPTLIIENWTPPRLPDEMRRQFEHSPRTMIYRTGLALKKWRAVCSFMRLRPRSGKGFYNRGRNGAGRDYRNRRYIVQWRLWPGCVIASLSARSARL